eukprot:CAMPEP_0202875880 /NCGR_PEP_ID=MMETSP1391-20130828/28092_1 /ASSEMBLY_ACC=CAM_ASM_000867 /TAXON_ID=1034604 /ORGANISM="Chlamydomonas leiostraca, Strain SAG 11-49" /LENGTH=70 /DNA_ID=CAMNT_0049557631 /DNA_START=33 /DNA_END=242 /DNA_ORIENTATION=+
MPSHGKVAAHLEHEEGAACPALLLYLPSPAYAVLLRCLWKNQRVLLLISASTRRQLLASSPTLTYALKRH